jgi:hypothetical protein
MTRLKNISIGAAVVILALASAEVFLRVMIPMEIIFRTWYSAGIHQPHEKFSYVFSPNYSGVMHHVDCVGGVPLRLDPYGFRLPAGTGSRDVVLIGGASMRFSFGLSDSQTVHAENSRQLDDATVRSAAWPGWEAYRGWHVYLDRLEPYVDADIAVVCLFRRVAGFFTNIDDEFTAPPDAAGTSVPLQSRPGHHQPRPDRPGARPRLLSDLCRAPPLRRRWPLVPRGTSRKATFRRRHGRCPVHRADEPHERALQAPRRAHACRLPPLP